MDGSVDGFTVALVFRIAFAIQIQIVFVAGLVVWPEVQIVFEVDCWVGIVFRILVRFKS